MAPVPLFIHAQYHIQDDGPLQNGAAWVSPKIVFCDPGMTKILGRVSYTQMKTDRDVPLISAIQVIKNNPQALVPEAASPAAAPGNGASSNAAGGASLVTGISDQILYIVLGVVVAIALICFWLARSRQ